MVEGQLSTTNSEGRVVTYPVCKLIWFVLSLNSPNSGLSCALAAKGRGRKMGAGLVCHSEPPGKGERTPSLVFETTLIWKNFFKSLKTSISRGPGARKEGCCPQLIHHDHRGQQETRAAPAGLPAHTCDGLIHRAGHEGTAEAGWKQSSGGPERHP